MPVSQPEHAAILEAIHGRDPAQASGLMRRHVLLLTTDIADCLHFARGTDHAGLFAAG